MLGPGHLSFPIIHLPFHLLSILIYDSIISSVLRAHTTQSSTGRWRGPIHAHGSPPTLTPWTGRAYRQEDPGGPQVLTRWHLCPGQAVVMCSPKSPPGTVACTGAHTPCTGSAAPVLLPMGDVGLAKDRPWHRVWLRLVIPGIAGDTQALAVAVVMPQHSGSGGEPVCLGQHPAG